jgi:hypothetical protein
MNQVHKETLEHVENALPNRQGLEVEIFGMEGIPAEVLDSHRNRLIQNFYQAQEDRRIATGNPLPGQPKPQRKKLKYETAEELKARLATWRKMKKDGIVMDQAPVPEVRTSSGMPASFTDRHQPAQQQPSYPQPPPDGGSYVAPPASTTGLPQRPGETPAGDNIDNVIRMAEAGVRPPGEAVAEPTKSAKKEKDKKGGRMFYDDAEISPEERMAQLPRYAFAPTA